MKFLFQPLPTAGHGSDQAGLCPLPFPSAKLGEGYSLKMSCPSNRAADAHGPAAVLTALGKQVDSGISGNILKKPRYGCGDKVFEKSPNALRVFLLETDFTSRV